MKNSKEKSNKYKVTDKNLLKDSLFLYKIVDAIHKLGVVGDDKVILCLLIKIFLRLVKNSDAVSSNLVLSDLSGSGKDFVTQKVCNFVVPESCFKFYTRISEKALNYFQCNWKYKVLYLEDIAQDFLNTAVLKVMASHGSKILVTDNSKDAKEISIVGKPVLIVTSYQAVVDEEGRRRWDYVRMDNSRGHCKAVIRNKGNAVSVNNIKLQKVLCSLKAYDVVIPFSDKITSMFPIDTNMITEVVKFLDYVKSSAVLMQKYRKKDKDGKIIAELFDYDFARFVFACFKSCGSVSLSYKQEELLNLIRNTRDSSVPVRYLVENSSMSKPSVYKHLDLLKSLGLVTFSYEFEKDANKEILYISSLYNVNTMFLNDLGNSGFNSVVARINEYRKKMKLEPV